MNNRDRQILLKILDEAKVVAGLIDGFDQGKFIGDERTKRAVCMTLINIGELVKNLSEEFRAAYKDMPWRAISGMRDITAHKYQTLRMEDVWITAKEDILSLESKIYELI